HEHVAFDAVPPSVVDTLQPPRRVGRDLDPGLALDLPELPLGAAAVPLDVEVRRHAEVALAPRGVADVGADARDAEALDDAVVLVLPDHVPGAVLRQQRIRVQRPLALVVACDRPVAELDRALLGDRALQPSEPALEL